MDYEKKYNEALAIAKETYETQPVYRALLEKMFPELRESEDERMMREFNDWLCEEIECRTNDLRDEKDRRTLNMLCYILTKVKERLEKQKEQPISAEEVLARAGLKPYKDGNQWCILAGDNIQEGVCGFGDTIEDALYEFLKEVLDFQKEQKPESCDCSRDEESYTNGIHHVLMNPEAYGLIKQKPASGNSEKPNNHAEWSEEDKKNLQGVIDEIEANKNAAPSYDIPTYDRYLSWLKSLHPQPHWKPSEEQMDVDLEKEIKNYLATKCAGDDEPSVSEIARHFAEWGAIHLNARKEG